MESWMRGPRSGHRGQTLVEVTTEKNVTLIIPIPVDLLAALRSMGLRGGPDKRLATVPVLF